MWRLLRIWHVETLSTIAHRSDAYTFGRTSYCVAPERWQALGREDLDARVGVLLAASYAKRNHLSAQSGDAAEMWLIAYDHEWVAPGTMAPEIDGEVDGVVLHNDEIHDALKERACHGWLSEARQTPRPGIDARPWKSGLSAFRVEESGETWHLVKRAEVDELFDRLLLPSPAQATAVES